MSPLFLTRTIPFDLRHRVASFAMAAAAIYAVALTVSRTLDGLAASEARLVALGVTLDLALLVPVLYWLLVVRGGAPRLTIVPVTLLSLSAAGAILPSRFHEGVRALEALAIPLELGLVAYLVWHVRRAANAESGAPDLFERLRRTSARVLGAGRPADILAFEAAILFYAFASWRQKPPAASPDIVTHHRRQLYSTLIIGLIMATTVEIVPVHLLVGRLSDTAAWILTGLSAYGILWLLGDLRAAVLRPSKIAGGVLHLRIGLRWNAEIPITRIREVRRAGRDLPTDDYLAATLVGPPNFVLELEEPVEVLGVYGIRRRARSIGLTADDEKAFEAALSPPATTVPAGAT